MLCTTWRHVGSEGIAPLILHVRFFLSVSLICHIIENFLHNWWISSPISPKRPSDPQSPWNRWQHVPQKRRGKKTYHPTLHKNPEDQHLRSNGLKQHDIISLTHHCLSSTNTAISLLNCCYFSIFYIYLHVLHSSSTLFSNLNATFSSLFSFTFPPLSLILSLTFTS